MLFTLAVIMAFERQDFLVRYTNVSINSDEADVLLQRQQQTGYSSTGTARAALYIPIR